MAAHFTMELDKLRRKLLSLATTVEERTRMAVDSVVNRDIEVAGEVMEGDFEVDRLEVEVEEECLKMIALYNPVAIDLRLIITALKINTDLERIGDLAVNIAERATFVATHPPVSVSLDLDEMGTKVLEMVEKSVDSFAMRDSRLAWEVLEDDDEVDDMNRRMYEIVQDAIRKHPDELETLIHMLSSSRHLERIADHATNIAEDVIYMQEGEIIRHRAEDFRDGNTY